MRGEGGETSQVSIERQLGDVVGTVRMAVSAIDTLRETVERLAERAAFRSDLEAVKGDLHRQIEDAKSEAERNKMVMSQELERQRSSFSSIQRWVWMAMGGLAVISFTLNWARPAIMAATGVGH